MIFNSQEVPSKNINHKSYSFALCSSDISEEIRVVVSKPNVSASAASHVL